MALSESLTCCHRPPGSWQQWRPPQVTPGWRRRWHSRRRHWRCCSRTVPSSWGRSRRRYSWTPPSPRAGRPEQRPARPHHQRRPAAPAAGPDSLTLSHGNALYSHIAASTPGPPPRFTHKRAQAPFPVLSYRDSRGTHFHSPPGAPTESGAPASHRDLPAYI